MQALNLPPANLTIREEGGKQVVFDNFRRRFVALTPEEWVRQHFLHWLVTQKAYPQGLIAVETTLPYLRLKKRADAIVYSQSGQPLMIIECKSPDIQITQHVFDQVARYNKPFGVAYLAVTNGIAHYCSRWLPSPATWQFLDTFPDYSQLAR